MSRAPSVEPPALAEGLVAGLIADAGLREAVLGDMAEEFADLRDRAGRQRASRWYWWQAVGAVPSLVRSSFSSPLVTVGVIAGALVAYVATAALIVASNVVWSRVLVRRFFVYGSDDACAAFAVLSLAGAALWSGAVTYAWNRHSGRAPLARALTLCGILVIIGAAWMGAGRGSSPLWYRIALHLAAAVASLVSAFMLVERRPAQGAFHP